MFWKFYKCWILCANKSFFLKWPAAQAHCVRSGNAQLKNKNIYNRTGLFSCTLSLFEILGPSHFIGWKIQQQSATPSTHLNKNPFKGPLREPKNPTRMNLYLIYLNDWVTYTPYCTVCQVVSFSFSSLSWKTDTKIK